MPDSIKALCDKILTRYRQHPPMNVFTIAISGIDASGKGYVAAQVKNFLDEKNLKVALLAMDEWQMPKSVALHDDNPAENFYHNVFRWNAFFDSLFFPLQKNKGVQLSVKQFSNPKDEVVTREYNFSNIDMIITEGIFLLKKDLYMLFDFKIWIECSFDKAMKRALHRNQEGRSDMDLAKDYNQYYFPAQQYHFEKDKPMQNADVVFDNSFGITL